MARPRSTSGAGIRLNASAVAAVFASALLLGACGGGTGTSSITEDEAPIALTPRNSTAQSGGGALTGTINDAELRKAVDRYRLVKQRAESAYDTAAADLNGDGRAEAIVLFTGKDWCQKTGCSLVVFQQDQTGFKPVSHITSARPPVSVGVDANYGWRDLIVKTGGGGAPIRDARLAFTGKGYMANALLQPEPTRETLSQTQQIMAESAAFTAAVN